MILGVAPLHVAQGARKGHRAESEGQQMDYKLIEEQGHELTWDQESRTNPNPQTYYLSLLQGHFWGNLKTRQILLSSNGLGTVLSEMVSQGHCKHGI